MSKQFSPPENICLCNGTHKKGFSKVMHFNLRKMCDIIIWVDARLI